MTKVFGERIEELAARKDRMIPVDLNNAGPSVLMAMGHLSGIFNYFSIFDLEKALPEVPRGISVIFEKNSI